MKKTSRSVCLLYCDYPLDDAHTSQHLLKCCNESSFSLLLCRTINARAFCAGDRIPGRVNLTQRSTRFATALTVYASSCLALVLGRGDWQLGTVNSLTASA